MNKIYERTYDFSWMVDDIDSSIIFMLANGEETIGSYQVKELLSADFDKVLVKFANIDDLTNFIHFASARFVDSLNEKNFIDIPIRNLHMLYSLSNQVGQTPRNSILLNKLGTFSVRDGRVSNDGGYALYVYKINEPSEELTTVLLAAAGFEEKNMNEKIDSLEEINLINYQRSKDNGMKK